MAEINSHNSSNPFFSDSQRRRFREKVNENGDKHFMATTVSSDSMKKILAERNDAFSDSCCVKRTPSVKPAITGVRSSGNRYGLVVDALSSAPYDPVNNYTSPRPEFLRYNPNRRQEILRRIEGELQNEGRLFESSGESPSSSSQESLRDNEVQESEQGDNDFSSEYEDAGEDDVEEKSRCFAVVLKLFLLLGVLFLSTCYISLMNSGSAPLFQVFENLSASRIEFQDQIFQNNGYLDVFSRLNRVPRPDFGILEMEREELLGYFGPHLGPESSIVSSLVKTEVNFAASKLEFDSSVPLGTEETKEEAAGFEKDEILSGNGALEKENGAALSGEEENFGIEAMEKEGLFGYCGPQLSESVVSRESLVHSSAESSILGSLAKAKSNFAASRPEINPSIVSEETREEAKFINTTKMYLEREQDLRISRIDENLILLLCLVPLPLILLGAICQRFLSSYQKAKLDLEEDACPPTPEKSFDNGVKSEFLIAFTDPQPCSSSSEPTSFFGMQPPRVELLGEFTSSCSAVLKRDLEGGEGRMKRKKTTLSSADKASVSVSWPSSDGGFISPKRHLRKEDPGDEVAGKAASTTYLRRSSRLRNRAKSRLS